MLIGSDCNNNVLQNVTGGQKRRDSRSIDRLIDTTQTDGEELRNIICSPQVRDPFFRVGQILKIFEFLERSKFLRGVNF